MRPIRASVVLSATLVALGCAGEPTAPRPEPEPGKLSAPIAASAAKGGDHAGPLDVHAVHVNLESMVVNAVVIDRYSFHVHGRPDALKGSFSLYQKRIINGDEVAVVVASGEMDCATITGNKARVGGTITWTDFPQGLPMGSQLTWSVTDNGKSAKADDTASQPLGNDAEAYCAAGLPYPERPVEKGKVMVRD